MSKGLLRVSLAIGALTALYVVMLAVAPAQPVESGASPEKG